MVSWGIFPVTQLAESDRQRGVSLQSRVEMGHLPHAREAIAGAPTPEIPRTVRKGWVCDMIGMNSWGAFLNIGNLQKRSTILRNTYVWHF